MKKRFTIYFDEEQHRQAKMRVAELRTNLSEYLAKLVAYEIENDLLKNQRCETTDSVA